MYTEKDLVYGKEKVYFSLLCIASVIFYLAFVLSIIGIAFLVILILIYWFIHNLALVRIRKNGVKIGEQQFPVFYEKAREVAAQMSMKTVPDIYIMQSGGVLNAFATKFGLKNMVVLYAEVFALVEEQGEEEVLYILAHEFAHIKRKHVGYGWLLMPGLMVPFLGNAYSRACEFTCDRYGAYYSQSFEGAKNGLVLLAVGPELYRQVDQHVFMQQIAAEDGMFSWIDEVMSTHPNLPRRIHALSAFFQREGTPEIKVSYKGPVLGVIGLTLVSMILLVGAFWVLKVIQEIPIFDADFTEEEVGYGYDTESMNDLMIAVVEWDMTVVEELASDESLLNEVNEEGYTALHLAVMEGNHEAAGYLLEQGANPDTTDVYEFTPLMEAATYDDYAMVELLLASGADKTITDSDGYDAYRYALEYGYADLAEYILNY